MVLHWEILCDKCDKPFSTAFPEDDKCPYCSEPAINSMKAHKFNGGKGGLQKSINRFITEEVLAQCWHKTVGTSTGLEYVCNKCGESLPSHISSKVNPDYCTSWEAFGRLWEKMRENGQFLSYLFQQRKKKHYVLSYLEPFINPARFAEAVARFYGWEGE